MMRNNFEVLAIMGHTSHVPSTPVKQIEPPASTPQEPTLKQASEATDMQQDPTL